MVDISRLEPIGRKLWTKMKWDAYAASRVAKAIKESNDVYEKPYEEKYQDNLERAKWRATIDRKVDYLLARPPVCTGRQEELDSLLNVIKETAKKVLLDGSCIWIVQGDGESVVPVPMIMTDAIAIYSDKHKEDVVAVIRRYVDIEIDRLTGTESEYEYLECYYEADGVSCRDTYCFSKEEADKQEAFEENVLFIELNKTGDTPLYAYVEGILTAYDTALKHQDRTTEVNSDPLIEVRGYEGTSDEDLKYALDKLRIARTSGTGGVTVHTRPMDSASMDLWQKRLMQEFYEATKTVGKENELAFAQSGKAMDRLFVDMENSARALASVLELALKAYFEYVGYGVVDIVWNTDRPVDDVAIVSAIQGSQGILSRRTLLEQHPWVDDVDEEEKRLEEEAVGGMEDLTDQGNEEAEADAEGELE